MAIAYSLYMIFGVVAPMQLFYNPDPEYNLIFSSLVYPNKSHVLGC